MLTYYKIYKGILEIIHRNILACLDSLVRFSIPPRYISNYFTLYFQYSTLYFQLFHAIFAFTSACVICPL